LLPFSLTATNDGGCLLAGIANQDINFPFLVKLASNGDWRWNRSYPNGLTVRASFSGASQTTDGGYIAVGSYPYAGIDKTLILKTDTDGNLNWNQTITSLVPFAAATSIKITNDNGYAVIGSLNGNIWLEKFAAQPNVSPAPTVPELSWVVIIPLLLCLMFVSLAILHRKP
jgi:hypothetical protein